MYVPKNIVASIILALSFFIVNPESQAAFDPKLEIQGYEYMKAKKYGKALECYGNLLKEKPANSWQVLLNMSNCYVALGELDKALSSLSSSIEIGGLHSTHCMNIASIYIKKGEPDRALSWVKKACELEPDLTLDPAVESITKQIQAVKRSVSISSRCEDYCSYLIKSRRWSAKALPLRVFVRTNLGLPSYREKFELIVKRSLEKWCRETGGALTYKFMDKKENANLIFDYTDRRELLDPDHEKGIEASTKTRVRMDDQTIDWANIIVLVKSSPTAPAFQEDTFIERTCLHEIGHALGIHGHSPVPADAMYANAKPHGPADLSSRDKKTIWKIYHQ